MIQIKPVKSCPVTRGTRGQVVLVEGLIAAINGALEAEPNTEWAILLLGERSPDGLLINVTSCMVPTEQQRNSGTVYLDGIEIPEGCVGVLHSHHSMGAWFSGTDDTELNPRYPMSIVVSTKMDGANETELAMGFKYKAEGRVSLPCGSLGIVDFDILLPYDEDEVRLPAPVFRADPIANLGDCNSRIPIKEDRFTSVFSTSCNEVEDEWVIRNQKVYGSSPIIATALPPAGITYTRERLSPSSTPATQEAAKRGLENKYPYLWQNSSSDDFSDYYKEWSRASKTRDDYYDIDAEDCLALLELGQITWQELQSWIKERPVAAAQLIELMGLQLLHPYLALEVHND